MRLSGWAKPVQRFLAFFDFEDAPSPDAAPPTRRHRLIAAIAIGLISASYTFLVVQDDRSTPDFEYPHTAAQLFLDGQNPYEVMHGKPTDPQPYDAPLFYPFTAILAILPFALLGTLAATSLFFGLCAAVLAWFITRDALWRIHIFASAPFVMAATLGQFSPLLMLMAFSPWLGFVAAIKPNLGLALFLRKPSVHAVIGSVALLLLSIAVFPDWPAWWLRSIRIDLANNMHKVPAFFGVGILLLLSVVAWKRPAGRLLLTLSLIPQALFFYDQLPLWLIPRTRKESIFLTGASQAGMLLWFIALDPGDNVTTSAYPFAIALVFLPALGILLHQQYGRRRA
jgi:hypothetical protein